ncbi:hypothetical protein PR048_016270 [Dryococelus australis]|uniref:HAT C-terminal dimerisation domain-containing protein n=1 Tax=Dryococelus australis TaxID=614101 RepID=A0ABQ9HJ93_9NEOP|nr:hypothetical protein PR048_016270 [Dryococelus australis]
MTAHEAKSLANIIKDYTSFSSLVIWYDVLLHINVVSKSLQSITTDVSDAICMIRENWHQNWNSRIDDWRNNNGRRKKVKQFTYEGEDEMVGDPTPHYKVEFYFHFLDIIIESLDERFTQLKSHSYSFDVLYDISTLKDMPSDVLNKKCSKLSSILQDNDSKDVNGDELCDELKVLSTLATSGIGPAETLKFTEQYNFAPNVGVALRILLTLPVTIASGQRRFSKLKLIKTYLRSTMLQSCLSGSALTLIEHQLAEKIDYAEDVKVFASSEARKVSFQ